MRPATRPDAGAIAEIYNEGILGREATFETELRDGRDIETWIAAAPRHPLLVASEEGTVAGWARTMPYSDRPAYAGVVECSVYVAHERRGRGLGGQLLDALAVAAQIRGRWKLTGKLFAENEASARLVRSRGFREVGVHRRHGRLDGAWRDVLVVERLLGDAIE